MLVQTMNAITWRFQNRRGPAERDPLALLEIDPLRPLNNFLWGYIQDEQHRLTVPRRAYEYDHHYGLTLLGKAVPQVRGADSRSRFLEAFHHLLFVCSVFLKEDDDTTVVADGFPVLNALKEVHLLLTQGAHNQYGDLPWTARQEMLMQQWMLATARVPGVPATADHGRLPRGLDGLRRDDEDSAGMDRHVGHALPRPGSVRRADPAGHPFRRVAQRDRVGTGGELGPLLAPRDPGLHPCVPCGDGRRPDRSRRYHDARSAPEASGGTSGAARRDPRRPARAAARSARLCARAAGGASAVFRRRRPGERPGKCSTSLPRSIWACGTRARA